MKLFNYIILLICIVVSSCAKKEETVEKVSPPSFIKYPVADVLVKQFDALNFIIPEFSGESVKFKISPPLPKGLVLNIDNGSLSGIAKEKSKNTKYEVTAFNSGGSVSTYINIQVDPKIIPTVSYDNSVYSFSKGVAIDPVDLSSFGANYVSFHIDSKLPDGLNFDTATGRIYGQPTTYTKVAFYNIYGLTDLGYKVYTSLSIQVNDDPPSNLKILEVQPNLSEVEKTTYEFEQNLKINKIIVKGEGGAVERYSIDPELPSGLIFDEYSGSISGTPLRKQEYINYTITAKNSGGQSTKVLRILVKDIPPKNLSYGTPSLSYVRTIKINDLIPSYTGGQITNYEISPALPAGLSLNKVSGIISGVPQEVSSIKQYLITGSNSGGSVTVKLNIFVRDLPPQNLSYPFVSKILIRGIPVEKITPTISGGIIAGYSINQALPTGVVFNEITGEITGTPTTLMETKSYQVTAFNPEGTSTTLFYLAVKDQAPDNLRYSSLSYSFEKMTSVGELSPTNDKGIITKYSITPSLPNGLIFDERTGVISGIPTSITDDIKYYIKGSNATGETTTQINIIIKDIPPSNLRYGSGNFTYDRGLGISKIVPSSFGGAIIEYTADPTMNLPKGLFIDSVSGEITGIPQDKAINHTTRIFAKNSGGVTSVDILFNIRDYPPVSNYPDTVSLFTIYEDASNRIFPENLGGAVEEYSISPALPRGLSFNKITGEVSGIPVAPAAGDLMSPYLSDTEYTITSKNNGGQYVDKILIRIIPEKPKINYSSLDLDVERKTTLNLSSNLEYNKGGESDSARQLLINSGFYNTSFDSVPVMDNGLSLNPTTGEISGTLLNNADTVEYSVNARNSFNSFSITFRIKVHEIPPQGISYPSVFGSLDVLNDGKLIVPRYIPEQGGDYPLIEINPIIPLTSGPIDSWLIQPSLPIGLSFDETTGKISGKPTVGTVEQNYTISAINITGRQDIQFILRIKDPPPQNLRYENLYYEFGKSSPVSISAPLYTGGTITSFSISPSLPNGIILDGASGRIYKQDGINLSGQDTVTYTVTGYHPEGNATTTIQIKILEDPPLNLDYIDALGLFESKIIYFSEGQTIKYFSPSNNGGMISSYSILEYGTVLPMAGFVVDKSQATLSPISWGSRLSGLDMNLTNGMISGSNLTRVNGNHLYYVKIRGTNSGGFVDTTNFIFLNKKPIACVPNSNIVATRLQIVSLDGRCSYDPDSSNWDFTQSNVGKNISYEWSIISAPSGSVTTLSGATSSTPSFTPDKSGIYTIGLKVFDGLVYSTTQTVSVTVRRVSPSGLSYGNDGIHQNNIFIIQSGGSFDRTPINSGDAIDSFSISSGSLPAGLSLNTTTGRIYGTVTTSSVGVVRITGSNDGGTTSVDVNFLINEKPTAVISPIGDSILGDPSGIELNGSSSIDSDVSNFSGVFLSDKRDLSYSWYLVSKPAGSNLSSSSIVQKQAGSNQIMKFIPDIEGTYSVKLIVNDGYLDSSEILKVINVRKITKNISISKNGVNGIINTSSSKIIYNSADSLDISFSYDLSDGPFSCSVSPSLPAGLTIDASCSKITGSTVILSDQDYTFSLKKYGTFVVGTKSFSLWINNKATISDSNPLIQNVDILDPSVVTNGVTMSININDSDYSKATSGGKYFDTTQSITSWEVIGKPLNSSGLIINKTGINTAAILGIGVDGTYVIKVSFFDGLFQTDSKYIKIETKNKETPNLEIPINLNYMGNPVHKEQSSILNGIYDGTEFFDFSNFSVNSSYNPNSLKLFEHNSQVEYIKSFTDNLGNPLTGSESNFSLFDIPAGLYEMKISINDVSKKQSMRKYFINAGAIEYNPSNILVNTNTSYEEVNKIFNFENATIIVQNGATLELKNSVFKNAIIKIDSGNLNISNSYLENITITGQSINSSCNLSIINSEIFNSTIFKESSVESLYPCVTGNIIVNKTILRDILNKIKVAGSSSLWVTESMILRSRGFVVGSTGQYDISKNYIRDVKDSNLLTVSSNNLSRNFKNNYILQSPSLIFSNTTPDILDVSENNFNNQFGIISTTYFDTSSKYKIYPVMTEIKEEQYLDGQNY